MVIAATSTAGCVTTGDHTTISEQHLTRVPASSMDGVNAARRDVEKAEERLSRQKVALKTAENELDVAGRERAAIVAEQEAAESASKGADLERDATAQMRQTQERSNNRARQQTAEARAKAAEAELELARADKRVAERELELARAQLELRKYEALQSIQASVVQQFSGLELSRRVDSERTGLEQARSDASEKRSRHQQLHGEWQRRAQRDRSRGIGGSGQ